MGQKVVIIGGVASGASAAAKLRRLDKQAEILILEKGEYISYANCGLPYFVGNVITETKRLIARTPQQMKENSDVEVRLKSEVLSIDRAQKSVLVRNLITGDRYAEPYDKLLIATGSTPIRPPLPGIDAPSVFSVWTIPDADAIKQYIDTHVVKRAAVIGGGFIGVEMADNFRNLGIHTTIIEMAPQILAPLDPEMAEPIANHLIEQGIVLILGDGVKELQPSGQGTRILTAQGKSVEADLVILAIGVKPNSQLAREAGLAVGERGGIIVDAELRTSDPSIYAAGDVIQSTDYVNHIPVMLPLAGPANRQGRTVAYSLAGRSEPYTGSLGTFIVSACEMAAASTGTNEKTLNKLGKQKGTDYDTVQIEAANHAGYYPDMQRLKLKAVYSLPEKKLLGAQVVGREGVDKRIDVLAAAIRLGATMSDLKELELAYAPMFSTPKDPVNILGERALRD